MRGKCPPTWKDGRLQMTVTCLEMCCTSYSAIQLPVLGCPHWTQVAYALLQASRERLPAVNSRASVWSGHKTKQVYICTRGIHAASGSCQSDQISDDHMHSWQGGARPADIETEGRACCKPDETRQFHPTHKIETGTAFTTPAFDRFLRAVFYVPCGVCACKLLLFEQLRK